MRVLPKAAIAFTSILPLNSGYTQAIEETNQMLSSMCSSCFFVYLLEPTFSVKQPRHKLKQLFSDVVHLNQRGLAILLRRIISFLPRSQRQLAHTKLTRQQRPGGDNVKSACDAAVRKLESASRRTQDPHNIFGITESRLDSRISDQDINIPNYCISKKDSIVIGQTGIAVYIHNSIADITHRRQDLESDLVEYI